MLQDKIALITHVGHFIGVPVARALAAEGARVFCHDESFADPAARVAFAGQHPDLEPIAHQAPTALVAEVAERAGPVEILINHDAFPAIRARLADAKLDDLRATLEGLVVAPFALAQAVVPAMQARRAGKIIFVTSATPLRGLPNFSMYVTGRGAANALATSLAKELARDNIQVNAFAPNYVESPTYFPPELLADPQAKAKITANIPLGRLGKPEEAAATIAFLASPSADFITGLVLPFAGGWA